MYLAETETNEIKKIVQIRVYLTGKDQAAAQPWQQEHSIPVFFIWRMKYISLIDRKTNLPPKIFISMEYEISQCLNIFCNVLCIDSCIYKSFYPTSIMLCCKI